ncbi:MAG TPA: hypothetical protein VJB59_09855 [Bdellovibrionota bacterium]|nr:hypothetical protein [Bdellovibrionota bacterium]
MPRESKAVATMLKEILRHHFGGKENCRYQISRQRLQKLVGKTTLRDADIQAIHEAGLELGIVVTDVGSGYAVQELDKMQNYRGVPESVIQLLLTAEERQKSQD